MFIRKASKKVIELYYWRSLFGLVMRLVVYGALIRLLPLKSAQGGHLNLKFGAFIC